MTTKEILLKYTYIIERVKRGDYPSLEVINEDIRKRFATIDKEVDFSKRTFLRDKNEIAELYGIEITYSRSENGYYISYMEENPGNERSLEAFNLFLTMSEANREDLKSLLIYDNKCLKGIENIFKLLPAVRHSLYVQFAYNKYDLDEITIRAVAPYTIKESQGRWYLVGKDKEDGIIKVFGLDRISGLAITQDTFKRDKDYDAEEFFEHRFGVDAQCDNNQVEEIVLSFGPLEGKYLKSKPLHPTQQIMADNSHEFRIAVSVYPSLDFFMALLAYGPNVKVIHPKWIADEVKNRHEEAYKHYLQMV